MTDKMDFREISDIEEERKTEKKNQENKTNMMWSKNKRIDISRKRNLKAGRKVWDNIRV